MILGIVAISAIALATAGSGTGAPSSRFIGGNIVAHHVTAADCALPVGLCTVGEFGSGPRGSFEFTAPSLTPPGEQVLRGSRLLLR